MEVLLDSSFIISCVRERIDFINQLKEQGFKPVVPREVLQEMKDLRLKDKTSRDDRIAIDVALQMIEKEKVKKTTLGNDKKVDDCLIDKGNEGIYVATLDRVIKSRIPKKIVIYKSKGTVGTG